jgi:hypothetical protein
MPSGQVTSSIGKLFPYGYLFNYYLTGKINNLAKRYIQAPGITIATDTDAAE